MDQNTHPNGAICSKLPPELLPASVCGRFRAKHRAVWRGDSDLFFQKNVLDECVALVEVIARLGCSAAQLSAYRLWRYHRQQRDPVFSQRSRRVGDD